ncbi:AEC family transporter [Paenibacillus pini]|uniref:Transporter n=1 Tax=Paenibacillus pini JCM 16418 TaxID=1236976 RepID=W7YCH1_9BACL|nr:AEC family transporter [Paenibacillus pini]GAF06132.1 transporter [Paenibacillus pini JCM 16418]
MLQTFISTVYHVFLPISLPVIGGALIRKFKKIDTKPLSVLSLYILSPALILDTLLKANITYGDVTQTTLFCIINLLLLWGISTGVGKILSLPPAERSGLTLITLFTNCVNYGLPLVLLALGQAGLDKASVYVIIQIIIVNTIGVYFAARSHFSMKQATLSVFKLPSIYAAAIAMILRMTNVELPQGLDQGVSMLAGAYASMALIVLGAQMVSANKQESATLTSSMNKAFYAGLVLRMILSPLASALILYIMGVRGILFDVLLILSSMPAAVNAVILAEQFDAAPKVVTKCILWTTLASFIMLPLMIGWMQ